MLLPVVLLVLAAAVLVTAGPQRLREPHDGVVSYSKTHSPFNASGTLHSQPVSDDPGSRELTLCECEKAVGSPDGLGCEKEGWFISNFEREGSWSQGAYGLVPLSHAICCRPCLPTDLPPASSGFIQPGDQPLAIVSIGCHASTGFGPASMQCEADGGSFVSGWSAAVRVSAGIDAYYPEGPVDCCTPSLLLSSGDAWQLERCDCEYSRDINCGLTDTHRLLEGFFTGRRAMTGELVPTAPARCCKACLGQQLHPINSCNALNQCSGRGVCALGACECRDGWTGADCSQRVAGAGGGLPGWLIALIVLSSCAAFIMLLAVFGSVIRYLQMRHAQENEEDAEGDGLRTPLILHIDDDDNGSVGSDDTTNCGESDFGEPTEQDGERRHRSRQPLGGGEFAEDATPQPEDEGPQETPVGSLPYSPSQGIPLQERHFDLQNAAAARQEAASAQGGDEVQTDAHDSASEDDESADEEEDAEGREGDSGPRQEIEAVSPRAPSNTAAVLPSQQESPHSHQEGQEGVKEEGGKDGLEPWCGNLTGISINADCSVCMNRPVQVVVIPCGHACMCRRCSRRLARCPVCRKEVARRQRLFIGG